MNISEYDENQNLAVSSINPKFSWIEHPNETHPRTYFFIEGNKVKNPLIEHNTALVHYKRDQGLNREELYRDKVRLINALRQGGFDVSGVDLTQMNPETNLKMIGQGLHEWPRDCFLSVPALNDNQEKAVLTLPLGKVEGEDPYVEILNQAGISPIGEKLIQSELALGGYSVYAGDIFIIQADIPEDDAGIKHLIESGYKVFRLPTLKAPHFRKDAVPIISNIASTKDINEINNRGNDHIDTEVGLFMKPDKSGMVMLVNESYSNVFRDQVQEVVNGIRQSKGLEVIVVPESEEQFLPAILFSALMDQSS